MTGTLVHECPTLESEENEEDQRDVSERACQVSFPSSSGSKRKGGPGSSDNPPVGSPSGCWEMSGSVITLAGMQSKFPEQQHCFCPTQTFKN